MKKLMEKYGLTVVTILILIDGFLQFNRANISGKKDIVTILILIDGFLQYLFSNMKTNTSQSHNPYFNRWFSAMLSHYKRMMYGEESQSLF